jgi:3-hydroxyacyl-CoA dehydrogenase/enoyl-CoA hydratase/3-hydroxybutyryl-CoA epimerase
MDVSSSRPGQLPFEGDVPPRGACVRRDEPEAGLVRLVFDPPHRSFPVLDAPLLADLEDAIAAIEAAPPRGLLFMGRRPDQFLAGADVRAIERARDPKVVEDAVRSVHALFARIDRLPCTVVAAVGGPVPGGAFELCLSCDAIVLANDDKTRIGLPETKLGLLPAWGGTHRLTQRIGVTAAADAILGGKLFDGKRALRLGLVDRLTAPEYLARIGADLAMGRERIRRRERGWRAFAIDRNPLVHAFVGRAARRQLDERTGGHYPAPYVALDAVLAASGMPRAKWADVEAKAAGKLVASDACRHLVGLFLGTEEQKKLATPAEPAGALPRFAKVGVVGAGVMGAGIASALAMAGIDVRLVDVARAALDRAQQEHRALVAKERRRLSNAKANAVLDRLSVGQGLDGLGQCDLVIEAVAERLDVKRSVFGELERRAPNAVLATNTSSLSVTKIAEGLARPERFAGLHFFNPVARMPLVEVVRGSRTSDAVFHALSALAVALGKTPVSVADVPGFLVNRLLGPYLDEAVLRFVNGANVVELDAAARRFGMPMGPFELLDEVGLDIASHAAKSLHEGYGTRMQPVDVLTRLVNPKRLGKKSGLGFYEHPARGKKRPAQDLGSFQGPRTSTLTAAQAFDACLFAFVTEALRCLEEGVVASARELDLAVVLGTGFAPFRGGPLHHVDALGASRVLRRLEELRAADAAEGRTRARFDAPAVLVEHARTGEPFHAGSSSGAA